MKLPSTTLPWERVAKTGYGVLDLKCVVFDAKTVMVKRLTPGEQQSGNFVVLLDGERVSDRHWATRADAIAEAERFVYDQPEFSGSNSAAAVQTPVTMGRQAFRDGKSVYQNPYAEADDPVSRANWAQGFLEEFGRHGARKAIAAAEATARANQQLESDNQYLTAFARVARLAINFAVNLSKTDKPRAAIEFLTDWATSNDEQAFYAKYPTWKEYRDADPNSTTPGSPSDK